MKLQITTPHLKDANAVKEYCDNLTNKDYSYCLARMKYAEWLHMIETNHHAIQFIWRKDAIIGTIENAFKLKKMKIELSINNADDLKLATETVVKMIGRG